MSAIPVRGSPALKIEAEDGRALVVADLHLGLEAELSQKGIGLPDQLPKLRERLLELLEREKPQRLVFLGDVKHSVPIATWQEWRGLFTLLAELGKLAKIEIIPGNHDGDIEGMIPPEVKLHDARGIIIGGVGLTHGHAWPSPELLKTKLLVMAHNHPTVELKSELGTRVVEPVWLKCKLKPKKLPEELRKVIQGEGPRLLIMPAFSELVAGAAVNKAIPEELLGPLFKAGAVDLPGAEVYLLDGTFLGKVQELTKLRE